MNRDSAKDNRILMITYVFPPAAYVGVYRTLKYCKYLRDYGWTPLVLTIEPSGVTYKDENLCRQVPDHVHVYRTLDIDPAKWTGKLSRSIRSFLNTSSRTETMSSQAPHRHIGTWTRLKRSLEALLINSPDSHIFWVPFAFLKGVRILLKEKVDIIYCSSPPHSSHIIAFLLAKCFRKPYVLDFRDPWFVSGSPHMASVKHPRLLKWEKDAKRVLVSKAAKVISVSRGEQDELREEFPDLKPEHFTCITNGYDPADFSGVQQNRKRSSKLILTHAGTIYPGAGREFLQALHQLLREHPGIEDEVQVQLFGEVADEYTENVHVLKARGILQTYGPQPHATALRAILESDVLIILLGGDKFLSSEIPSKVFEYLYAGKPILAIAKDGELTSIAKNSGLGILVSPESHESVENLAQTLWGLYKDYAAGQLTRVPNQSYIRSFERAALTGKLAMILNEVKGAHTVCS